MMKTRSRSSENIGIRHQKRIESGRNIMNASNMSKLKKTDSRESVASNYDIKSINKRSMTNLHNVHGMNQDELRTMQSQQADMQNDQDTEWYKNKVIRDFIRQDM